MNRMPNRTERIAFVVSPSEKELIRRNAFDKGKSMSSFVRNLAIRADVSNNEVMDTVEEWIDKTNEQLSDIEQCACRRVVADVPVEIRSEGVDEEEIWEEFERKQMVPPQRLRPPPSTARIECTPTSDGTAMVCELKGFFEAGLTTPSAIAGAKSEED